MQRKISPSPPPSVSYKDFLSQSNTPPSIKQIELPNQDILDDALLSVKSNSPRQMPSMDSNDSIEQNSPSECPYTHKRGNISGCPFLNSTDKEPKHKKFEYHYEIPMPETPRDFYFNVLNYTNDGLEKSKWLRSLPNYLRNTLFIQNPKINEIRKKEFSVIFLISEDLKDKAHEFYKSKKYQSAINSYTLIYSIFKWIQFKDKEKEIKVLKHFDFSKENAILDEDIELKRAQCDPQMSYEEGAYRTSVINLLKALSYCYIQLRHYTIARQCMDEAIEYVGASRADVLFRRAQSIMYNKFSKVSELEKALCDLKEVDELKKGKKDEMIIKEHLKELEDIIKEKRERKVDRIKRIIDNVNYAYDVITKKKLDVKDAIYASYNDIDFDYKIVIEMKDTYYSSIKFFQDTKKEKELLKIIKEFDAFFDFYFQIKYYYNLRINNIENDIIEHLNKDDIELIEKIKTNEIMRLLFNDFRLKECEKLYGDFEWNMTIWKYCFDTVNEREKKLKEKKEKIEAKKRKNERWKFIKNKKLNKIAFTIFTIVLFTMSLLTIGFHVMYYKEDKSSLN